MRGDNPEQKEEDIRQRYQQELDRRNDIGDRLNAVNDSIGWRRWPTWSEAGELGALQSQWADRNAEVEKVDQEYMKFLTWFYPPRRRVNTNA